MCLNKKEFLGSYFSAVSYLSSYKLVLQGIVHYTNGSCPNFINNNTYFGVRNMGVTFTWLNT
ncbi:hypothetical protein HanPI659440_Chr15g0598891 [Helianthus annuus]|nr:hypothetical protein HanPI659440_Chr15g0598891 [Helianthus annuus]